MKAKSGSGRPTAGNCFCDKPTCKESWVCRRIGEYKIIYDFLEEQEKRDPNWTLAELKAHVESEWEILIK